MTAAAHLCSSRGVRRRDAPSGALQGASRTAARGPSSFASCAIPSALTQRQAMERLSNYSSQASVTCQQNGGDEADRVRAPSDFGRSRCCSGARDRRSFTRQALLLRYVCLTEEKSTPLDPCCGGPGLGLQPLLTWCVLASQCRCMKLAGMSPLAFLKWYLQHTHSKQFCATTPTKSMRAHQCYLRHSPVLGVHASMFSEHLPFNRHFARLQLGWLTHLTGPPAPPLDSIGRRVVLTRAQLHTMLTPGSKPQPACQPQSGHKTRLGKHAVWRRSPSGPFDLVHTTGDLVAGSLLASVPSRLRPAACRERGLAVCAYPLAQ